MKLLALSVISALAVAASVYYLADSNSSSGVPAHIEAVYRQWKSEHGRLSSSGAEETYRLAIFAENYAKIQAHNATGATWTMGLGPFTDLTDDEFRAGYLTHIPEMAEPTTFWTASSPVTASHFDLRDYGAVQEIKNQGRCGSCWAFSTVANIESAWKHQAHNPLPNLSEQQLVDCSKVNHGCHGGLPSNAFIEMMKNKWALTSQWNYPYVGAQNQCRFISSYGVASIKSAVRVKGMDSAMMSAVQKLGALTVGIDASTLPHYTGGVFHYSCEGNMNHAVNIIGFGTDASGTDYWIMRNSWSTKWGESGYFKLPRNVNKCSVNKLVTSATM